MTDRMHAGELQSVREYLGLTTEALARILSVRTDTVRRWESGRERVPERVREEIEDIEQHTARTVTAIIDSLIDQPDPAAVVYRTDTDMHAELATGDIPWGEHLTARWWRHAVARAAEELPGLIIGTRAEIGDATPVTRTLSTTLTATDAWHDRTTITVTWAPKELRDVDGDPLFFDRKTWAHGDVDDPPAQIGQDRSSGLVTWGSVTRSHAGDTEVTTCFYEVPTVAEVVPGSYHVRVHEADDED